MSGPGNAPPPTPSAGLGSAPSEFIASRRNFVAHFARRCRQQRSYAVAIVLGGALLSAAVLKGYDLATKPTVNHGMFSTFWVGLAVVDVELELGLLLVLRALPGQTRAAALCWFVALFGVATAKWFRGESSCGCFGDVRISPILAMAFDGAAVGALVAWPPRRVVTPTRGPQWRVSYGLLPATVVLTALCSVALLSNRPEPTPLTLIGIAGGSKFVVLEPSRWLGKRCPLLQYIEGGDVLGEGRCTVVLVRPHCPKCAAAMAAHCADSKSRADHGTRTVFIEVPVNDEDRLPVAVPKECECIIRKLTPTWNWIVETPLSFALDAGVVLAPEASDASTP